MHSMATVLVEGVSRSPCPTPYALQDMILEGCAIDEARKILVEARGARRDWRVRSSKKDCHCPTVTCFTLCWSTPFTDLCSRGLTSSTIGVAKSEIQGKRNSPLASVLPPLTIAWMVQACWDASRWNAATVAADLGASLGMLNFLGWETAHTAPSGLSSTTLCPFGLCQARECK